MPDPAPDSQRAPAGGPEAVTFWLAELTRYDKEFGPWRKDAAKIVKRYRDERSERSKTVRYSVLWSNVQTLKPAVYSHMPAPVVERRFLDRDPLARIASQTLERAIEVQLDTGGFLTSTDMAVTDHLLPGRGTVWVRYEPQYGDPIESEPAEGEEAPAREVVWEKVCVDYVHWTDFAHTPTRYWDEVWWVGRRLWLSKEDGKKQFGKVFKTIAPKKAGDADAPSSEQGERADKVEVWEIWDKAKGEVIFIAPDKPDAPLKKEADPLGLQGFWPCPPPLYATTTSDSLVPVPDYHEYRGQAEELDRITARIAVITKALRVAGVYDSSVPQLAHILEDTSDNRMIPVASWATLQQAGGVAGGTSFLPIKDIAAVLMQLYEARDIAKRDLFEITGISDIVRGQGSAGAPPTATEQRIKGQFASLRLDDRRKAVARFVRDTIAIIGEIVAEHFSAETVIEMTGMLDNVMKELPPPAPQGPQQPGMPMQQPDPAMLAQMQKQQALMVLNQALELLKNDKMRTFRIDIETDSTVEADQAVDKEAVVEFMSASAQFLNQALPVAQAAPPLIKPLAEAMLYAMRRFKMGRSVEAAFEQALEQLEQAAQQPPGGGGDPQAEAEAAAAKATAQAAQMKAQTDVQVAQIKAAADIQKAQTEIQVQQAELALKAQKLKAEMRKIEMEAAADEAAHRMKMRQMSMQAAEAAARPTNGAGNA